MVTSPISQKKNTAPATIFFLSLYFFVMCFQGGLIFSQWNIGSLQNPQLPQAFKIVDETILVVILLCFAFTLIKSGRASFYSSLRKISGVGHVFLPFIFLFLVYAQSWAKSGNFDYLRLSKNSIEAILIIAIYCIYANSENRRKIESMLGTALGLSFIFGILHYIYDPYEVYGARIFGTYANPNVTAASGFFFLALQLHIWRRENKLPRSKIALASIAIFCAGSATISALVVIYAFLLTPFDRTRARKHNPQAGFCKCPWKILNYPLTLVAIGFIFGAMLNPKVIESSYLNKINIFQRTSSSYEVRVDALQTEFNIAFSRDEDSTAEIKIDSTRSDSFLLNLYRISGLLAPLGFLASTMIALGLDQPKNKNVKPSERGRILRCPLALYILFMALPFSVMHYSVEDVPTCCFLALACVIRVLSNSEAHPMAK